MTRHPLPSDPEAAGASPPETKNARPGDGEGGSGEQSDTDTANATTQAPESPLAALCKAFVRAGPTDRRLFLQDVRAGASNLWREVERDARRH